MKAADTDLFTRLIRSKRDAEDGSDDPAKPDDLIHTAAHNVYRNGKADTTVGSARGVDGRVDTCSRGAFDSIAFSNEPTGAGCATPIVINRVSGVSESLESSWARQGRSHCPPT